MTDAELEAWSSHDGLTTEARRALTDEQDRRARAMEEALGYPTFEAYDQAIRRAVQEGGFAPICGMGARAAAAARKAVYEKAWAANLEATSRG